MDIKLKGMAAVILIVGSILFIWFAVTHDGPLATVKESLLHGDLNLTEIPNAGASPQIQCKQKGVRMNDKEIADKIVEDFRGDSGGWRSDNKKDDNSYLSYRIRSAITTARDEERLKTIEQVVRYLQEEDCEFIAENVHKKFVGCEICHDGDDDYED